MAFFSHIFPFYSAPLYPHLYQGHSWASILLFALSWVSCSVTSTFYPDCPFLSSLALSNQRSCPFPPPSLVISEPFCRKLTQSHWLAFAWFTVASPSRALRAAQCHFLSPLWLFPPTHHSICLNCHSLSISFFLTCLCPYFLTIKIKNKGNQMGTLPFPSPTRSAHLREGMCLPGRASPPPQPWGSSSAIPRGLGAIVTSLVSLSTE